MNGMRVHSRCSGGCSRHTTFIKVVAVFLGDPCPHSWGRRRNPTRTPVTMVDYRSMC